MLSSSWYYLEADHVSCRIIECVGADAGYLPYSNRTSDIWALGIILINMVSNRSPWQKAITTDNCFCEFLLDEEYLLKQLPISREANALFRKIFVYEPSERIKLTALRKEIIALPTFFMNDEELARAGEDAREVASSLGVHVEPIQGGLSAKAFMAKIMGVAHGRTPAKTPRASPPRYDDVPAPSLDVTDANSSSLLSSLGPATPGSYPGQHEMFFSELELQLGDLKLTGLIKDEQMPHAPRTRRSARVPAA